MTVQERSGGSAFTNVVQVYRTIDQILPPEELTQRELQRNAVTVVGAIHALAVQRGIKPPEAAIRELPDHTQDVVRDLIKAPDWSIATGRKPVPAATVARVGRLAAYMDTQVPVS